MSKKILYINFNIVMHPYFNTYAHHIQDNNLSPDAVWDKLNKELNLYEQKTNIPHYNIVFFANL